MFTAKWNGVGEGSQVDPFRLDMPSNYTVDAPFNIRLENNFFANKREYNYFRLSSDQTVTYLLGVVIVSDSDNLTVVSKDAIRFTALLNDLVDFTDGPYIVTVYNGINYILRQQLISTSDLKRSRTPVNFFVGDKRPVEVFEGDFWLKTNVDLNEVSINPAVFNTNSAIKFAEDDYNYDDTIEGLVIEQTRDFYGNVIEKDTKEEENYFEAKTRDENGNII